MTSYDPTVWQQPYDPVKSLFFGPKVLDLLKGPLEKGDSRHVDNRSKRQKKEKEKDHPKRELLLKPLPLMR